MTMLLFSGRFTRAGQVMTFTGDTFQFGQSPLGFGHSSYPLIFKGTIQKGAQIKVIGIL